MFLYVYRLHFLPGRSLFESSYLLPILSPGSATFSLLICGSSSETLGAGPLLAVFSTSLGLAFSLPLRCLLMRSACFYCSYVHQSFLYSACLLSPVEYACLCSTGEDTPLRYFMKAFGFASYTCIPPCGLLALSVG